MLCENIPISETNERVLLSTYVIERSTQYDTDVKRPAVLVLPGGSYAYTSDREAEFVALSFTAQGYHAFVLRYSVGVNALAPAPLIDGLRAIALIRDRAEEWNIDGEKVAVCGFSAGGHLAAGMMTMWKDEMVVNRIGRAPEILRPDAGILCYALLNISHRMPPIDTGMRVGERDSLIESLHVQKDGSLQHPDVAQAVFEKDGTLWVDSSMIGDLNCFGTKNPTAQQLAHYDLVDWVDEDTPPAFLWATTPDDVVPVANSLLFAQEMIKHNRPVELHVFASGGHGLSLAKRITGHEDDDHPATRWFELALTWLRTAFFTPDLLNNSPFADMLAEDDEKPAQYYDNIYNDREGMFRHTPFSLEQRLVQYVTDGNEAAALETLSSINRQGDKAVLARDPLRSAKNSIICSCTFLTRAVIRAGVSDAEAFALSDAAIQHIETLSRKEDVFAYEQTLLVQAIRLVNKRKGKTYTTPIRKTLHYVDSHLDRPLSLEEIAKFVRVHPNYLSKRFKQEMGMTLSRYIIASKIHEAVYFVRHSEYSMAEIAALYGFSSQSYFISSFKKIQGVSPGKYRAMYEIPKE